jgi:hypothetical protein
MFLVVSIPAVPHLMGHLHVGRAHRGARRDLDKVGCPADERPVMPERADVHL